MMIGKEGVAFGMSAQNFANSGREGFVSFSGSDRFSIGIRFYNPPTEDQEDRTYSRSDLRKLREAINYILEETKP